MRGVLGPEALTTPPFDITRAQVAESLTKVTDATPSETAETLKTLTITPAADQMVVLRKIECDVSHDANASWLATAECQETGNPGNGVVDTFGSFTSQGDGDAESSGATVAQKQTQCFGNPGPNPDPPPNFTCEGCLLEQPHCTLDVFAAGSLAVERRFGFGQVVTVRFKIRFAKNPDSLITAYCIRNARVTYDLLRLRGGLLP